ncbi:sulfatase-like hydrolase/transferase [Edaphobacter bradus]|uniref:sulfatase-like hydrolase/transferase n=1 Tax=Edaphobacter bradus TaxID=2259016 RepID=UPI0021E03467|nr:sulfatase-like hydrolase/transferase [Edaphobacter bradus]
MKRRDFLKTTAAVAGASVASRLGFAKNTTEPGPQPNILFILVDELRWPTVFPMGVNDAENYFKRFMPNLYKHIWKKGVKFSNYYTAACACTPSRGTIITGLYSHQSWLIGTITTNPNVPVLNPAYPTFGKLLQAAGYTTPYFGKWHVSVPNGPSDTAPYGFAWDSPPDPTGYNLQGTYGAPAMPPDTPVFNNDAYTTGQAIAYLENVKTTDAPWCLTVGYVNPHDREFFPAGTEFLTFTNLFASYNQNKPTSAQLKQVVDYTNTPPIVNWDTNATKSPPPFGYPNLPPNWQDPSNYAAAGKPTTHTYMQLLQEAVWGGVTANQSQQGFQVLPYPDGPQGPTGFGVGFAPFTYWQRGLDSYTQITKFLDDQIGDLLGELNKLPQSIIDNTVIIFASDHGEYNGAHGFVQGKIGTVYEECMHIPLIVMDPSGRFTDDTNVIRTGLCSSVDLLNMFVTLGNKGDTTWLTQSPYNQIYNNRHDMYSMLKSRFAPGRSYLLFATDEIAPGYFNFNGSPTNILALRTEDTKVGAYYDWFPLSTKINPATVQLEFYDYSTKAGQLELNSDPDDPRAEQGYDALVNNYLPNELAAHLPGSPLDPTSLRFQQIKSEIAHVAFRDLIAHQPPPTWQSGGLRTLLGYGGQF